jgi:hypothetical protein
VKVSWDQVHAWRLRRQFVDPRGNADAVHIVSRLCGVQAQVASSAELAVRMRQAKPETGAVERGIAADPHGGLCGSGMVNTQVGDGVDGFGGEASRLVETVSAGADL